MLKYLLLCAVSVCISVSVSAGDLWLQAYTNVDNINGIGIHGDYIWYGTSGGGVVCYNRKTESHVIFTTLDGLASNYIRSLYVGPDGDVWIGTDRLGIAYYNGEKWVTYPDKDREFYSVNDFVEDDEGNIWIAGDGVTCFDGKERIHYNIGGTGSITKDQNGYIWCTSDNKIYKYDGSTWKEFTNEDSIFELSYVYGIIVDKNNVKWFTSWDARIASFDGTKWQKHDPSGEEKTPSSFFIGNDGNVWAYCFGVLYRFNDEKEWEIVLSQETFPEKMRTYGIIFDVDEDGVLWMFGGIEGLWSYDGKSSKSHRINSIAQNEVYSIAEDHDGIMWFGTYYKGISRFDGTEWITYDEGIYSIKSIIVDRLNRKWFGSANGAACFDGETWTHYTTKNSGLPDNNVNTIFEDRNGTIWFGTKNGLSSFDGSLWTDYTSETTHFMNNNILSIAESPDGVLWFGTWKNLNSFNGETWTLHKPFRDEWDAPFKYLVFDSKGILWCNVISQIVKYDGIKWKNYTEEKGRLNEKFGYGGVSTIAIDHDDVLWIANGSGYGFQWFYNDLWFSYEKYEGIAPEYIYTIYVDRQNIKLIGTDVGVYQLFDESADVEQPTAESSPFIVISSFPNPFNPTTTIEFSLPSSGFTSFIIYNIMGQKVRELLAENFQAGTHTIIWDGKDDNGNTVSSGIYISRLKNGEHVAVKNMTLIK